MIIKYTIRSLVDAEHAQVNTSNWRNCYKKVCKRQDKIPWADHQPLGELIRAGNPVQGVRAKNHIHNLYIDVGAECVPIAPAKERTLVIGRIAYPIPRATTVAIGGSEHADYETDNLDFLHGLFRYNSFTTVILDFASNMVTPSAVADAVTICRALAYDTDQVYGRCLIGDTRVGSNDPVMYAHKLPPAGVKWLEVYERTT